MTILVENLHARFIGDWLSNPSPDYVHPKCSWTLGEGHPITDINAGANFYSWYTSQFSVPNGHWKLLVSSVIGSSIGAIVVGRIHFQEVESARGHTASFAHFYRIRQGKIIHVQCFLGEITKSIFSSQELAEFFPANTLPSLN